MALLTLSAAPCGRGIDQRWTRTNTAGSPANWPTVPHGSGRRRPAEGAGDGSADRRQDRTAAPGRSRRRRGPGRAVTAHRVGRGLDERAPLTWPGKNEHGPAGTPDRGFGPPPPWCNPLNPPAGSPGLDEPVPSCWPYPCRSAGARSRRAVDQDEHRRSAGELANRAP